MSCTMVKFLAQCKKAQLIEIARIVGQPVGGSVGGMRFALATYLRSNPEECSKVPGMEHLAPGGDEDEEEMMKWEVEEEQAAPVVTLDTLAALMQCMNQQNLDTVKTIVDGLKVPVSTQTSPSSLAVATTKSVPLVDSFLKEARHRKLSFSGIGHAALPLFLRGIQDLREVYQISDSDCLKILPSLLEGHAQRWWRLNKSRFTTWAEVITELKKLYENPNRNVDLRVKIYTRRQGLHESASEFLVAVRNMNEDLVHPIPESELLEVVQSHLHPEVSRIVGKEKLHTYLEFEEKCREAEVLTQQWRNFQPASEAELVDPLYGNPETMRKNDIGGRRRVPVMPMAPDTNRSAGPASSSRGGRQLFCWDCGKEGVTRTQCCAKQQAAERPQNRMGAPTRPDGRRVAFDSRGIETYQRDNPSRELIRTVEELAKEVRDLRARVAGSSPKPEENC